MSELEVRFNTHSLCRIEPEEPSAAEVALVSAILNLPCADSEAFLTQLDSVLVGRRCSHCQTLQFQVPGEPDLAEDGAPMLPLERSLLAELHVEDVDGQTAQALLFASKGSLLGLEVFRGDLEPIRDLAKAATAGLWGLVDGTMRHRQIANPLASKTEA